jgi:hypothetical protein
VTAVGQVLSNESHFGHRESGGLIVDLFWKHGKLEDEFRVEVADARGGERLLLYPTTGREAVHAFNHPFAALAAIADTPQAA